MKILCLIQCTNLGGMEQCTLLLLEELQRRGIETEVLSLNPVGELGPLLEQRGIPVEGIAYRGRGGWRSFGELRRRLNRIQADAMIMVGHNLMGILAAGRKWKPHQVLAIHYHHQGVMPNWQWRLIYRLAAARFPRIVFPSGFIRQEALAIAPFLEPVSQILGYPFPIREIPTAASKMKARLHLDLPSDAKIVGNAGWLIPRKRWDIFLEVAGRVAKKNSKIWFLIAGDGPQRAELEARAHNLGIHDRVRWLGWQKDLSEFYHALDVMVFNSDWDAMPRTPLEAMSYAVPVVVSVLNGGTKEIITDASVGFCLPQHDVDKLAGHVLHLLSDDDAALRVGMAGRERIMAGGDPKLYADGMLQALGYR